MTNPITDAFSFLTANTGDFNALGLWKYLILLLFYALLAGSLWLAVVNWREDPAERNGKALWLGFSRLLIGCMWFQGTLWKLPFGDQNGLWYWTQQMAGRAAFEIPPRVRHRRDSAELRHRQSARLSRRARLCDRADARALRSPCGPRGGAVHGEPLARNLQPAPRRSRGMAVELHVPYPLCGTFAVFAAGRSLGADAWLRRNLASVREGRGLGALVRLLT